MKKKRAKRVVQRPGSGRRKTGVPSLGRIALRDGVSTERQVYQALRYAFMSGAVLPGASLSSRSLSVELGVSPTPVREALKRLDGDGAVVSRRKSAFFVFDPDRTDLAEILEIRLMLEGRAIRRAAVQVKAEDIARLRAINDVYQQAVKDGERPGPAALQANFRFHFEIYRLSGSVALVDIIEAIWLRMGPALHHYVPKHGDTSATDYHERMLKALAVRNPDGAEAALHEELSNGFDMIAPHLRQRD